MKKIWLKIKRHLSLIIACLLSFGMILGLWLFSRQYKPINTLSASAEEVETASVGDTQNGLNLFCVSQDFSTLYHLDCFKEMGRLSVRTISAGYPVFEYCFNLLAGVYYFSCDLTTEFAPIGYGENYFLIRQSSSALFYKWFSGELNAKKISFSFTVPVDGSIRFAFYPYTDWQDLPQQQYCATFSNIMLSKDAALPYTPNLQDYKKEIENDMRADLETEYYEIGYGTGYNDGERDGYGVGREDGYLVGFEDGKEEGYNIGLNAGIEQGMGDDPYKIENLVFAIVDAPFRAIREALNFEIFGFNVSSLVLFILTGAVVIFVLKMLKG